MTATNTTPDTLNLTVTRAQAERLLALVDAENAARKNHLVSAVTSTTDFADQALSIAEDSQYLTTLRAAIAHRLNTTLAR